MKQKAYARAGVDIDLGNKVKATLPQLLASTHRREVLGKVGGFGGLFALDVKRYQQPVLVSSVDGVGTKLKIAFAMNRHDTIGQDLVNHCVNDILVQGARPLFFLDYFAAGRLVPSRLASVVEGLGKACRENGCALLGGETAEMPGLYQGDDFDLAGFIVGSVRRDQLLPRGVAAGDVLLGLPSTGLHTNGYSLARRLFLEQKGYDVGTRLEELGATVGDALLAVHRSYLGTLLPLVAEGSGLTAMAHITGGGILDNLPRVLPEGVQAVVDPSGWEEPALFRYIRREGRVPEEDMRRTFNLGVGMVLCVEKDRADDVVARLRADGEKPFPVGILRQGPRGVIYV